LVRGTSALRLAFPLDKARPPDSLPNDQTPCIDFLAGRVERWVTTRDASPVAIANQRYYYYTSIS
jgi:hypothetical protein